MHAIVKARPGPGAEISTVDQPTVQENEVLVKVKVASICGTDMHVWNWDKSMSDRIKKFPLVIGHEFCGVIVDVGKSVTSLQIGDYVSAETHIVDGTCYQCRTDRMHICQNLEILGLDRDGAFAEYVALPERNAWKNDPNLDPEVASIQEPLGNAIQTVLPKDSVEDVAGKTVAVLGCGPIGLMAIAVARELGAASIFATAGGSNKVRMELATKMGADEVLNAQEDGEKIPQMVLDKTHGNGVDVVLEMSGSSTALQQAFRMLTPGGRVSLLGLFTNPVALDVNSAIVFKAAKIYGISGRRMFETWFQAKGLLSKQSFQDKIASIITHRMAMANISEGIELIKQKAAAKVVLKPEW